MSTTASVTEVSHHHALQRQTTTSYLQLVNFFLLSSTLSFLPRLFCIADKDSPMIFSSARGFLVALLLSLTSLSLFVWTFLRTRSTNLASRLRFRPRSITQNCQRRKAVTLHPLPLLLFASHGDVNSNNIHHHHEVPFVSLHGPQQLFLLGSAGR